MTGDGGGGPDLDYQNWLSLTLITVDANSPIEIVSTIVLITCLLIAIGLLS